MIKLKNTMPIVLMLPLIIGCDWLVYERGNGEMVVNTEYVENFDEIFLNGNFEVFLEQGHRGAKYAARHDDVVTGRAQAHDGCQNGRHAGRRRHRLFRIF